MSGVRPASWVDLPRLRQLLATAYADDPLMVWTFPEPEHRRAAIAAWLGLFVEQGLQTGAVDVVVVGGDVVAVAA